MGDFRSDAPAVVRGHWDAMPNSVRALYATVHPVGFPWLKKEIRVEAWGQLCFDDAAARHTARQMRRNHMGRGWKFLSWRVEMDGPLVGPNAKMSGKAPDDFSVEKYADR
jgi:hypothetical protein